MLSKNKRNITVGLVILMVAAAAVVTGYSLHLFDRTGSSGPACTSAPPASSSTMNFTIIISNKGFNASRTYAPPCPVLNVMKGQTVRIHLENTDPVEAHGFAITHYLDSGVLLGPGQTKDIPPFTVSQTGSFLIYCNIICSIHLYMQNGRLNVS